MDHLELAREDLAIAESGDAKREAYKRAAEHIAAYRDESHDGKYRQTAASYCNTSLATIDKLMQWRDSGYAAPTPFLMDEKATSRAARSHAKAVLRDPEQRRELLNAMTPTEIEDVIEDAHERRVADARARHAEHETTPTTRDLMGDEPFDPSEFWADTLIIRTNRNARELSSLVQRGGGLLFGTMPVEEAFDYLSESERLIAEVRAAAQELLRDRAEVQ